MRVTNRICELTNSINSSMAPGTFDEHFIAHHGGKAWGGYGWIGAETWLLDSPFPPEAADEVGLAVGFASHYAIYEGPGFAETLARFYADVHRAGAVAVAQLATLCATWSPSEIPVIGAQDFTPHAVGEAEIEFFLNTMHGTLERDRLVLVAESNESIVELHVREGDAVATGDLLLRQEAGTMQARLDQARAAVVEAERRLADAVAGPRQREIDQARAALRGAESSLATEQKEYDRVDTLVERKLLSTSSRDQARARRDAALAARDEARARLRLLEEGTRPEQVRQARAPVDRTRASLAELETSAARYERRRAYPCCGGTPSRCDPKSPYRGS